MTAIACVSGSGDSSTSYSGTGHFGTTGDNATL
jgi:hypothetical protein